MRTKRFLYVLIAVAVLVLAACAPQAATETPSPEIVETPASVPSTSSSASNPEPASTPGDCPCFEGLSSGLDNATQARVRTVNLLMGSPTTDVYVNGLPALDGGVLQGNIGAGQLSGWLYVAPGNYTVALVPHGGTIDQALLAPTEVKVEAGHRYTVAAMGQLADQDIHPLLVDETALEAGLGALPSDNKTIDINNMKGAESITELAYGNVAGENIKYGEAGAWFCAPGTPPLKTLANGKTQGVLWDDPDHADPNTSFMIPWLGPFPAANYDLVGNLSQGTSELNVVDFLAGFDSYDVQMQLDGHKTTFNILLKLIDKAGIRDELVNKGPYFLMAPTDGAFAALPQADLDALLNDPQALVNLLNAHIVDGYFPYGSLSGIVYGHAHRIVTNRLGQSLAFIEDDLNGRPIGPNYTVGNGNRVQIIYTLLPSE